MYSSAISQLESGDIDARIGGIYALQRVMDLSPTKYQLPVIQVLSAFVREHAIRAHPTTPPNPDIESATQVIVDSGFPSQEDQLDLDGAYLDHDDIHGGSFPHANLSGISFGGANLQGIYAPFVDLGSSDLSGSDLSLDLSGADLMGAILDDGTDLTGTTLKNVNFNGSHMAGALFDSKTTKLNQVSFRGADLRGARFVGARLWHVDMSGALLTETDLRGVDLSQVKGLTESQIRFARLNAQTKLPYYLT